MNDIEIEKMLIELIDNYLKDKDNSIHYDNKYSVRWEDNLWSFKSKCSDPLSLILVAKNPEQVRSGDDNLITATISKILDKAPWYIRSFQCGFSGESNSSMSIAGYILGRKLRIRYKI